MIRVLYIGWQRFNERSNFLVCWATAGRSDRATGVVRFADFRFEVKCRCFRHGDEKIAGCRGQFLFQNEFVNDVFDNFLISLCEIFVDLCIEFSVV